MAKQIRYIDAIEFCTAAKKNEMSFYIIETCPKYVQKQ